MADGARCGKVLAKGRAFRRWCIMLQYALHALHAMLHTGQAQSHWRGAEPLSTTGAKTLYVVPTSCRSASLTPTSPMPQPPRSAGLWASPPLAERSAAPSGAAAMALCG